MVFIVKLL